MTVEEPLYRHKNWRLRPFKEGAKIRSCGCSRPLQRAIVDFAADQPFAQAQAKLREHYGLEIGESTIQRITFDHAKAMHESSRTEREFPEKPGKHKTIITQTDGGMIPVVQTDPGQKDRRKGKTLLWREAKLSLAHAKGSKTPVYAATIEGGADKAGAQLFDCALRAGFGVDSHVHAVGDGAPWIVGQIEERFGEQGRYLIDFYHVCEYLAAASTAVRADAAGQKRWVEAQKDALKFGRAEAVLQALASHAEPNETPDDEAPARRCHRYLTARRKQLFYDEALAAGLPIGSGEIESAHRYVAQQRLKRPGAWWKVEHAEYMLALRVLRINGDWEKYWSRPQDMAAPANQNQKAASNPRAA
jgi:Uncharacterised protein family (UPF0236)